jgi:hypothetical protein
MRSIVYTVPATDVANGFTVPFVLDYNRVNGMYGIQYLTAAAAAGTGTMQYTLDDPFNIPTLGMTWSTLTLTSGRTQINGAYKALRVLTPVLNDVITIVAQGASAAG